MAKNETVGVTGFDLADFSLIDGLFTYLDQNRVPTILYMASGITSVELCEVNPILSKVINVDGTLRVFQNAVARGYKVVFYSTDYVFDGQAGPYSEKSITNPLNVYGQHKLLVEQALSTMTANYLIIRTSSVFSWHPQGMNFAMQVYGVLNNAGMTMKIPQDQVVSPTYAPFLADTTIRLAREGKTGIYNVVCGQVMSKSTFAHQLLRYFGSVGMTKVLDRVNFLDTVVMGQKAQRPLKAGLTPTRLQAENYQLCPIDLGIKYMYQQAQTLAHP